MCYRTSSYVTAAVVPANAVRLGVRFRFFVRFVFWPLTGGTLKNLELQPGFYRSSAQSIDVRECFHEDACRGGGTLGGYCAPGYGGPCECFFFFSFFG